MASARPRRLMEEANENEQEARDATTPRPPPLSIPRSPLISIPNPSQTPKSAQTTPKSTVARLSTRRFSDLSPLSEPRGTTRERSCSRKLLESCRNLGSIEQCTETPCFELDEDLSFCKERNVQVLIRLRPISKNESALHGHRRCLIQESSQSVTWVGNGNPESCFTFDHVACESISQLEERVIPLSVLKKIGDNNNDLRKEKLFKAVGIPMVENCMSGYNSCMFAYGQTGSGKTYTMMGELQWVENNPSEDCGITPRVFEYLFARIIEEEEKRREERVKYSCRCSFIQIYNEQITDLLEPSSTNLHLREDVKKGVYVEGLKECEVSSVNDIMLLLLQGASNRKIAATNMNGESSRSHSVLTCVIESQWEKDSLTHLRFARLNLVDLAGSERQKSSGAEGERLKEAANINRSLSTLGLVIMSLVDIANGKSRHVPYRDSRLTFLLQDSLGGNSKTTIIATVSPSICSSSETLSTLKFAQRAKLIQNNAKVNEDSLGDVMALQRQIQVLKDQLESLKLSRDPTNLIDPSCSSQPDNLGATFSEPHAKAIEDYSESDAVILSNQKVGELEAALAGSLRRERIAEAEVKKLKAEMKHMERLVHLIENDAQRFQEKLKMREEKIRRLELLADGLISSDEYLMEENVMLRKEIDLLKHQSDINPQLNKFALENMRLLQQIKMLDNYYQFGERELLLAEIKQLRNQLRTAFDWKNLAQSQDAIPHIEIEKQTLTDTSENFSLLNGLEVQIKDLTQENEKLMESIACRDTEWETAIVELTSFLSNSCESLEDASDSIDSLVSAFPKRESLSLVNSHVERAIRVSLERERLVHDLSEKLKETRRLEKELKGKLDCVRGATLAMTELQQRELLESLPGPGALKHTSPSEVFLDASVFDKMADVHQGELMDMRKSVCNLSVIGSSQSLQAGAKLASNESPSEVKHVEVTKRPEICAISAATLLSNFEKAQETMAEAELILSSLLQATETARGERDSVIESHSLTIEELTHAVSSIEESFHKIKHIITEEFGVVRTDITLLVKELKEWVEKSRAMFMNLPLKREIGRKDEIVEGLFFDLRLLQESTSGKSSIRKKYQETIEKMQEQQEVLKMDISSLRSQLERTQKLCSSFEKGSNELHLLLEEEVSKRAEIEKMLKEKSMVINGLEKEILSLNRSIVRELQKEKEHLGREREELEKEILHLKARYEMAMALAEEKEAISVEAYHAAEMSKMQVEEKEQEVQLLEHSVGELEATIDVLEGKVHDLKEEVESYQQIRMHLELQVKELNEKISFLQNGEGDNSEDDEIARSVELDEAKRYIEDLETEVQHKDEEIERYKDHISELVLHSEAQSSLYQEKFRALENMVSSAKTNNRLASDTNSDGDKTEMPVVRTRGSGSPFKCISNIVNQVQMEKERELCKARSHVHELEALLSAKHQEVCVLSARLTAVDTMTHDVIKDLLGVKLDMINYANLVDQEQLENLLVKSHQQAEESNAKDLEMLNLRRQIDQLFHEKESLVEDINQQKAIMLANQLVVEELEQKENLLSTKNKMLKMDKANLQKRILEMDEAMKLLVASNSARAESVSRNEAIEGEFKFKKRLEQADRLLSHVRKEMYLPQHRNECQQLKLKRPSFIDHCSQHK